MNEERKKTSTKALLYWLKHNPSDIGLTIKREGWADLSSLVENSRRKHKVTLEEVEDIVNTDEKNRMTISEDKKFIRANEGHTIKIR